MKPCCGRCKFWDKRTSQTGNCKNQEILDMVVDMMQATYEGMSNPVVIKTRFYSRCESFKQRR